MDTNNNERRFTLRISDLESKELDKLKKILNESTDTGVLRYIILNYNNVVEQLNREKFVTKELNSYSNKLESKLNNFLSAFENLKLTK